MFLFDIIQRTYTAIFPPTASKNDDAIRIGLLGASKIAPVVVVNPAKSHPDVIVAAVAARDSERAKQYAKTHGIPIVHSSYQALVNDPSIDAIYVALPNGLHYEWALRSIRAGKHVLIEKPSCSNAIEARKLFNHPLVTAQNAPVLLEAFHYQFHPAWQTFLSEVRRFPGAIKDVYAGFFLPAGIVGVDDIRFQYSLAGGCMMDVGTYPLSCVRQIIGREAILEPIDVKYRGIAHGSDGKSESLQIDEAIEAKYRTADSINVHISGDEMTKGGRPSFLPASWTRNMPSLRWPKSSVTFEPVLVDTLVRENKSPLQHFVQRTVTLWNPIIPTFYHRIDICDQHTLRQENDIAKTWSETNYKTAYNWPEGDKRASIYQDWWTTYRCQLEEFVNRVKGREGSGVWVDGAESIAQMEAIDRTYKKAGLKLRPTSTFEL
ncbi:uncharacterized protein N7482_004632 [Penicillium canariense]|uniref:D-xylose 1-dehydrogenase (NADP(+), D-xylono-1,5-lactone-forming) n=1 Tax=Penicillium canariense TaxID=189055 RepID=A0A9W9I939_9EURO|nr:uncharacterized protein N7482_004632 [Penicillium canariense]KAJ5169038.1 hypothetical protein N7482_004632 [Penicillium canariense]